jgi:hypothetical protein
LPGRPANGKSFQQSGSHVDRVPKAARRCRQRLALPNCTDTGSHAPGEYRLADEAYAQLVRKLAERDPATLDPKLRADVLAFFSDLSQPFATKKNPKDWQKTVTAIKKLRTPIP